MPYKKADVVGGAACGPTAMPACGHGPTGACAGRLTRHMWRVTILHMCEIA